MGERKGLQVVDVVVVTRMCDQWDGGRLVRREVFRDIIIWGRQA